MKKVIFTLLLVNLSCFLFAQKTEQGKLTATFKQSTKDKVLFTDVNSKNWEFYKNGSDFKGIKLFTLDEKSGNNIDNPEYIGKKLNIIYTWIDAKVYVGEENSDMVTKKVKIIKSLELVE